MKAVILGTGATIGTLGGKGGVKGFEERLNEVRPSWQDDYRNLKKAIDACKKSRDEKINLDQVWTRIDYYSKFRKILNGDYGSDASIELHKAVLVAYSFKKEISNICNKRHDFTLINELKELGRGDALISFNWDTLAENIVMKMLEESLIQSPDPDSSKYIQLIKPHGSLSWVHKKDGTVIFKEGSKPRLNPMTENDVDEDEAEPLVLGAVPVKSEIIEEVQRGDHIKVFTTISDQWRETIRVISQADEVVVLGYSFPNEDTYGRFLLREAVRNRPKKHRLPKIRYYALTEHRCDIEKAFREIFSDEVNYEYMGKIKRAKEL